MHAEEIHTDIPLVHRLLAAQFPDWTELPISRVQSFGTDNALYRLGDDLMARLPRIGWAVGQIEKELEWLPRLAPLLPLRVPQPLALGQPGEGYPYTWGVYRWLPGEMLSLAGMAARPELARQLADFVLALRACDVTGAPGEHPATELLELDPHVRAAIQASAELLDTRTRERITAVWDEAMKLPGWTDAPVWVQGDLHSNNLLWNGERLTAVLDFASLELNDPAIDLMVVWNAMNAEGRRIYREVLKPDDATWARGRARALAKAMQALPYYQHTNPEMMERSRYTIGEVLADTPEVEQSRQPRLAIVESMTGAIVLPRDLQDRLDAYAQEHGLTERQALEELIPRRGEQGQASAPEDTLTPAERRRAAQGRRDIEQGDFVDGPAFFDSLRQ